MTHLQIQNRIEMNFPTAQVEVLDLTGTSDHFEVRMIYKEFKGMTRIKQHKAIMDLFSAELKTGEVHALAIKTEF